MAGGEMLTPRQAEIAELLARGLSRKAIARILGITPARIRQVVEAIEKKAARSQPHTPHEFLRRVRQRKLHDASEMGGMCTVYFIYAPTVGLVKIGAAVDPHERFKDIDSSSPVPLRLLGYVVAMREFEAELHAEFADQRRRGEWFALSPRMAERIEALMDGELGENIAAEEAA